MKCQFNCECLLVNNVIDKNPWRNFLVVIWTPSCYLPGHCTITSHPINKETCQDTHPSLQCIIVSKHSFMLSRFPHGSLYTTPISFHFLVRNVTNLTLPSPPTHTHTRTHSYSLPVPFEEEWGHQELLKATKIYIDMVWSHISTPFDVSAHTHVLNCRRSYIMYTSFLM